MCARRNNQLLASSKVQDKRTNYLKEGANIQAFHNQLRRCNLKLRNIIGDGNCLFRSFADQMDGDQNSYPYYREKICHFIQMNREDFEPFITGKSFDEFIHILSKDGTFAGNECLVAFSRHFDAKICIHQLNQPVWIVCFSNFPRHEINISYHNFEHYSSVRKLDDNTTNLANIRQVITTNENEYEVNNFFDEYDVDYIQSQITNTISRQSIRDKLLENNADLDRTIAYFLSFDIPTSTIEESKESIEKIISITDIYDIELIQETFKNNNFDIDLTVENLLKFTNEETLENQMMKKSQCLSNNQTKINKKKVKKERAMEKHRAQILAEKKVIKPIEAKLQIPVNNEQEYVPPANMEFIRI